jgi:hypothetical protein
MEDAKEEDGGNQMIFHLYFLSKRFDYKYQNWKYLYGRDASVEVTINGMN